MSVDIFHSLERPKERKLGPKALEKMSNGYPHPRVRVLQKNPNFPRCEDSHKFRICPKGPRNVLKGKSFIKVMGTQNSIIVRPIPLGNKKGFTCSHFGLKISGGEVEVRWIDSLGCRQTFPVNKSFAFPLLFCFFLCKFKN